MWRLSELGTCLPVMGLLGIPAAQARRIARIQEGEMMTGKGGQLATGGALTNPVRSWYHWNIPHCKPCSRCHLLRLVQFALVNLGPVLQVAVGITGFRLGEPC
jgi:hypothetical protein